MNKRVVARLSALVAVFSLGATLLVTGVAGAATPPAGTAGALDTTFGSGGVATVTVSGLTLTALTKTIVQPDGKILVGGLKPGTAGSVTVARLNTNGSLDTTFGSPNGYVKPGLGSSNSSDGAQIALQSDGKILVTGAESTGSKVVVARLNSNGSIDTTFGTSGFAKTTLSGSPLVRGSGIVAPSAGPQAGKIIVSAIAGSSGNFTALRYNSNGTLDTTFGTNGIAQATTAGGYVSAYDLALTSDGRIVEVGTSKNSGQFDTAVARFTATGQPDTTFPGAGSQNGTITFNLASGKTDAGNAVTIDQSGRLLVSGTISTSPSTAFVLALSSQAVVDNSFGTAGVVKGTFGGVAATGAGSALDGNGRLLVAGGDGPATGTNALGIERLLPTGANPYDPTFGLTTTPGRESVACATGQTGGGTAVAVQPNQQILLAGNCGGALKVARLNAANITNLTMVTTTTNAASGHPVVPLSSIPSNVLTSAAGALGSSTLRNNPIFGAPFGQSPFGQGPFGQSPFGQGPFGQGPFGQSPFGQSPFGQGPFGQSPFGQGPFGQGPFGQGSQAPVLLSDITLRAPKTWDQIVAGTPCASVPIQSLTLAYVYANCSNAALQSLVLNDIQVNATPLRNVSYIAFALGWTPIANLPSPCSYIVNQNVTCSEVNTAQATLFELELAGDNLSQYYAATTINLNGTTLVQAPIASARLSAARLADTTLGSVVVSTLRTPGQFVTCGSGCPAGQTLAQSQANGQLVSSSSATVGALIADSPAAVGPVPLANLLVGLLLKESLPVEQLPVDEIIATSPLPTTGTAAYKIDFDLGCGAAAGLTVRPTLPTGFRSIPSKTTMTVGGSSKPVNVAADGAITPQTPISCSGLQHVVVNLQAEPTTVLTGPLTSGVTVTNGVETVSVNNQAPVNIVDPTNSSAVASTPPSNAGSTDTVYVDHIGRPGNVDYFSLPPQPAGSAIIVTLSHLPADYDVVLYGAVPSSLRGAPFGQSPFGQSPFGQGPFGQGPFGQGTLLAADDALSPAADGTITPPEVLQDVPLLSDRAVRSAGVQRGTTDEAAYALTTEEDTTPFTIQVSGFNGASSPEPYVLRVTIIPPPAALPCAARTLPNSGTQGSLPASLPANTRTIFLVNQKRLGDLYGAPAAANVMSKLNTLASYVDPSNHEFDVRGAVLAIDGDAAIRSDVAAWDASPCSATAANKVVADTNKLVDRLRGGLTDLRYVVVVGGDEVVPFGRVPDRSAKANEASAGADAVTRGTNNPVSSSLSSSYILSDNPYGDVDPSTIGATPLYVPQLAVGRLVETPPDITTAIDQYIGSNGVRTPNASFNAAYDWMLATGQAVDSAVGGRVPAGSASTQFSDSWTRQDAQNGLNVAAHGFISINAHSNFSQTLPANDFKTNTGTPNVLSTADLPANLQNGVLLTLGCHVGLSVADTYIANPNAQEQAALLDWSEATIRNGGVLQAPTGYGIGDTEVLAYSSRLLGIYAQKLDGSSSIGQALMFAKQQYFQLGVASVYDAKAIEEATFYGLPMYRLGSNGSVAASVVPALTSTPPSQSATGTTSASFSSPLTQVTTTDGAGSYFVVGNEAPQVTPNEPIEPKTVIPLTPPASGVVAHDAVIEQQTTKDIQGFNPVYSATSTAAGNALAPEPNVKTAAFPSQLHETVTTVGPSGYGNALVLIPGQFSSDNSGTGTGTQRNVVSAVITQNWSNINDWIRPGIDTVVGSITGSTATFTVTTSSTDVKRGVLLFLPVGGPAAQAWTHVELVNAGGGRWTGTAHLAAGVTTIGQFNVSLCDLAGNCGHSSNKARNYAANPLASAFSFSLPSANANGVYPDPTNVTITGPTGTTFTVTVDGAAPQSCTTSCVRVVSGQGAHVLRATASDGTFAEAAIPIANPPVVNVSVPVANSRHKLSAVVSTSFTCSSAVTLTGCTGPATLDTSSIGNHTATFTATDQFGQRTTVNVPYYVDGTPPAFSFNQTPPTITNDGTATFQFSATDPDESGYAVTFTCALDNAPPTACTSPKTVNVPAPIDGTHTFKVVASDRVGNTTLEAFTWRIDTSQPGFQSFIGPADPTSQTTATFAYSVEDPPDTALLTFSCTLDGGSVPCTSTGAGPFTGLTAQVAAHVFVVTARDPAGNTTTRTHSWHIYESTTVSATGVVPGVPQLKATLRGGSNQPLARQKLLFTRGQAGAGGTVPCTGANPDGTVTTADDGTATCSVSLGELTNVIFNGGFKATFATTPPYFGSSGSAGVV